MHSVLVMLLYKVFVAFKSGTQENLMLPRTPSTNQKVKQVWGRRDQFKKKTGAEIGWLSWSYKKKQIIIIVNTNTIAATIMNEFYFDVSKCRHSSLNKYNLKMHVFQSKNPNRKTFLKFTAYCYPELINAF